MEGSVSQIIGPVADVRFPDSEETWMLPAANEALALGLDSPEFDELADITPND